VRGCREASIAISGIGSLVPVPIAWIVCSRLLGVHDHLLVLGVLLKNVKKARDRGPSP